MHSMTGYAHRLVEESDVTVEVEIRSVNNRFLKLSTRLDAALTPFEPRIHNLLRQKLHRGSVQATIHYRPGQDCAPYRINRPAFTALLGECREAFEAAGLSHPVDPNVLLSLEGVLEPQSISPERIEHDWPLLENLILDTATDLIQMRATEGLHLQKDLTLRHENVGKLLETIRSRAEEVIGHIRKRLTERVSKLLEGERVNLSESDLAREIAIHADRSDVQEEIERIDSHLEQFATTLQSEGEIGRKLEFILQELVRETNTIGSKTVDPVSSRVVIEIKGELERLREQIQNVE